MLKRKPFVGEVLTYQTDRQPKSLEVLRVVGNICHVRDSNGFETSIIWRFERGDMGEARESFSTLLSHIPGSEEE